MADKTKNVPRRFSIEGCIGAAIGKKIDITIDKVRAEKIEIDIIR